MPSAPGGVARRPNSPLSLVFPPDGVVAYPALALRGFTITNRRFGPDQNGLPRPVAVMCRATLSRLDYRRGCIIQCAKHNTGAEQALGDKDFSGRAA